jgi:hypothetical protein
VINGQVVDITRELRLDVPYKESSCAVVRAREARFG